MSKTRIYLVNDGGDRQRLVRAANKAQARNHVARKMIGARIATQDDLLQLAGTVAVENADDDDTKE